MPQRDFFWGIEILVFDFELFIGGRRQWVSDIDRYIVTGMPQRKFFCGSMEFIIWLWAFHRCTRSKERELTIFLRCQIFGALFHLYCIGTSRSGYSILLNCISFLSSYTCKRRIVADIRPLSWFLINQLGRKNLKKTTKKMSFFS